MAEVQRASHCVNLQQEERGGESRVPDPHTEKEGLVTRQVFVDDTRILTQSIRL